MALHQMALFGSTPIGAVLIRVVIQATGLRMPFAIGGLTALACAAAVQSRRPRSTGRPHGPAADHAEPDAPNAPTVLIAVLTQSN